MKLFILKSLKPPALFRLPEPHKVAVFEQLYIKKYNTVIVTLKLQNVWLKNQRYVAEFPGGITRLDFRAIFQDFSFFSTNFQLIGVATKRRNFFSLSWTYFIR